MYAQHVLKKASDRHSDEEKLPVGTFEVAVLAAVSDLGDRAYAAEITRHLTVGLERRVALAQVFLSLERLEDKGFLRSREIPPEPVRGGRRRRVFQLEASGVQVISKTADHADVEVETSNVGASGRRSPLPT